MNWKFWQKDAPQVETKSAIPYYIMGDVNSGSYAEWLGCGYSRLTPQQAANFYRTSSAIAIAIDTIADEAEKIMPVLEINGKFTDSHPLLDKIKAPNPYETRQQFIGALVRDWLLNHSAFVAAAGNLRAEPASIYSISPQRVSGSLGANELPLQYNIPTGAIQGNFVRELDKRRIRFVDGPLKEFYQIKGYSSRPNSLWADSPLEAALLEAKQQIEGRTHNLKLLQNGARLSLIAIFKHPLQEEELAQRRQALNEQIGGSSNAGKIATVSSDELELKEVGKTNKDMDYANLDAVAFKTVMIRYKIPLPIVTDSAMTDNNFSEAVFQLYDRAILPAFEYVMSGLGDFLLPRYGLDPTKARLTYDPESIESLRQRTLENLQKRRDLNIETINELREDLPDREAVDDGDVIYQAATLIPLGEDMSASDELNNTEDNIRRQNERDPDNEN